MSQMRDFYVPLGLAARVKSKGEVCMISLPPFLGEAMCVVLWAEPLVRWWNEFSQLDGDCGKGDALEISDHM